MRRAPRPIHPAKVMAIFWLLVYAIFLLAPIVQRPAISFAGFAFVLAMLLCFCGAGFAASQGMARSRIRPAVVHVSNGQPNRPLQLSQRSRRTALILLIIGVSGAAMGAAAKLSAADLYSLAGLAALRSERAQQLLDAEAISSGWLGAVSFLTYPAGFAGLVHGLVDFERHDKATRLLALAFVPMAFLLSVISGGRSTVLVIIVFVGLAVHIRRCRQLPGLPRWRPLRWMVLALVLAFAAYSTVIWQVRSDLSALTLDSSLEHAATVWGVTPTPGLDSFAEAVGDPSLVQSVMSTVFYFTQSLAIVEKVISMPDPPIMLGAYHIDIVAAMLRAMPGGRDFLGSGNARLLDADIYGFFTGAWGALVIDCGWAGAFPAAVIWGWFAGRHYRRVRADIYSRYVGMYVFWTYSCLISFVSPPFGFSNSAITFVWFLIQLKRESPLHHRGAALTPEAARRGDASPRPAS